MRHSNEKKHFRGDSLEQVGTALVLRFVLVEPASNIEHFGDVVAGAAANAVGVLGGASEDRIDVQKFEGFVELLGFGNGCAIVGFAGHDHRGSLHFSDEIGERALHVIVGVVPRIAGEPVFGDEGNVGGKSEAVPINDRVERSGGTETVGVLDGPAGKDAAAAQTFSYDPFGNISKPGSPYSFQPTYSPSTNRMTSLPGFTPSYDANGNLLNDNSHAYTWDADGNSVTVDGVGLTYDALDRMVEQNRSGSYTQIVYAPAGGKLALMSGQSLVKAFVPLPGQATAVYTSSGLDHYRHSDWLGSARLTSSPSRSYLSSVAYAPFGETYAQSGSADVSFTGQNSDTVSGGYDFLFREYSMQGRWASPDPAGLAAVDPTNPQSRSEEHTSELQSLAYLVCRLLLEKKKKKKLSRRGHTITRRRHVR